MKAILITLIMAQNGQVLKYVSSQDFPSMVECQKHEELTALPTHPAQLLIAKCHPNTGKAPQ